MRLKPFWGVVLIATLLALTGCNACRDKAIARQHEWEHTLAQSFPFGTKETDVHAWADTQGLKFNHDYHDPRKVQLMLEKIECSPGFPCSDWSVQAWLVFTAQHTLETIEVKSLGACL